MSTSILPDYWMSIPLVWDQSTNCKGNWYTRNYSKWYFVRWGVGVLSSSSTRPWTGAETLNQSFDFSGCHLLLQMSSQWGSQKLLQGLVCHELRIYLSILNQFKLNELWPYYQKHVNQIILNCTTLENLALQIFETFAQILLIGNLSLNQTLMTFLLCVKQTWMTQLILTIFPWEVIFL